MKMKMSSGKDQINSTEITLQKIKDSLSLPFHVSQKFIDVLKEYHSLKRQCQKQYKLNNVKDTTLSSIIRMFQSKESKILTKLRSLQQINIKYIQMYVQAKKKSTKSKSSLNMSLNIESKIQKKQNLRQQQILSKSAEDLENLQFQVTQSIFKSPQWTTLMKNSQQKLREIQNGQGQLIPQEKSSLKKLCQTFVKCIDSYAFEKDSFSSKKVNSLNNVIQKLIIKKKEQIDQNTILRKNIQLANDLQRLKGLLIKANQFNAKVERLKKNVNVEDELLQRQLSQILEEKIQLENLIEAENKSFQETDSLDGQGKKIIKEFKANQRKKFSELCKVMSETLNARNQEDSIQTLLLKVQKQSEQHKDSIQQNLASLEQYIVGLQAESKKDKQFISTLKTQNQKVCASIKQLEKMKEKYEFYMSQQDVLDQKKNQKHSPEPVSKVTQKLDQIFSREAMEKQKQLLRQCLQKKDELIQIQKHQLATSKENIVKIESKIKNYFEEQGIQFSFDKGHESNFQQLFQTYSKSLTKQAYQRYPQQKTQMNKIAQSKYQKIVQSQREQYQQRIDSLKEQIKLSELQRQSYKNSLTSQQKQFAKLKQFTQKLVMKKNDVEMQNSKTEEILKTVLDMMFAYLMSNISYENLLQQIQATIENIKICLRYRERQKERQSKDSPMIDYRFSGLSAVSNDFSFSKLNKESYCDYFNEDSDIDEESEVISKISSQDQVLPPSRPSYSTNNAQKRQMGLMDINQRATMAHEDQSLLGYLNPTTQIRTPRIEYQRNTVLIDGLHDDNIRSLESNLGYLKNRIPEQTIQVQRQVQLDSKEMYIKYKQALKCLQQAQKINQQNQIHYQTFLKSLKQEGVFETNEKIQNKLFYMEKTIKEQQKLIEQQRIEFQTTIAKQVIESQKTMNKLIKNLNSSISSSRR